MTWSLSPLDGRLELKGFLGEGGMGQVHRAWDQVLERPVAVKFLRGTDPREAERLLLEARLQARVDHPHVVKVHEVGTLDGRPCIVLQLVEGHSLAELAPTLGLAAKVELLRQVAEGLHAAHCQGLLHRDIKPGNVLVEQATEGLRALVSDFGLARDQEGGLTRSGFPAGTLDFMSPEQLLGRGPLDLRSDVYSLGATLYSVLSGRLPYRSHLHASPESTTAAEDPAQVLRHILEDEPPPLLGLVPGLPRELSLIVAKAMEKDPTLRYESALAFAEDLGRFERGEAIRARPLGWLERGVRWARHNPIALRAMGAGLLAMLAAGGFSAWNARRSTLAAMEAAQVGAEGKALELRLRMAHLAAPHELRPVQAELRAGLARLAGRQGAAATAADYARGRIFLLLGQLDEARQALESARAQGTRGQDLEEALGLVYGRLYERDLPRAEALQDQGLRTQRLAELDRSLKAPALRHLRAAGNTLLQQAYAALLEQRFDEARAFARRAREQDPERVEATLLEVQTWYREGRAALNERHLDRARSCATQGLSQAQGLLEDLRSDPAVPVIAAQLKGLEAVVALQRGQDVQRPCQEGQALVDRALALDPDAFAALLLRATLLETQSTAESDGFLRDSPLRAEALVAACQRLVALAPERPEGHAMLAVAFRHRGTNQEKHLGLDPTEAYRRGRQEGLEAHRLEPWNPEGLLHACQNAMAEADFLRTRPSDEGEALKAAEGLFRQLEGARGLDPSRLKTLHAELFTLQGRHAWFHGQDPDPFYEEGFRLYDALLKEEPDAPSRLVDLAYTAAAWAGLRFASGREAASILGRTLPALERGILRWPSYRAMLLIIRSRLLTLWASGRVDGRPTILEAGVKAKATAAVDQAMATVKHPLPRLMNGYLQLAQGLAGVPGTGARALALVEPIFKTSPDIGTSRLCVVLALRLRGQPTDLSRALTLINHPGPSDSLDPEWGVFRAVVLAAMGRLDEANRERAEVLARQPLLAKHPVWAVWPRTRAVHPAR